MLETLEEESPAAAALLERFAHAADDFRNDRFKLIPRLVRAPLTLRPASARWLGRAGGAR